MGYASIAGRARTSSVSPRAHAICDRCGYRYNFEDLRWQFDWRGAMIQNLRILVCQRCEDTPQEQLRTIVLPPDPMPIINARPELYSEDSTDYMSPITGATIDATTGLPIPSTTQMQTLAGANMNPQPVGPSANPRSNLGLDINAQAPLVATFKWAQPVPFLSISTAGTTVVTVTCGVAHGLATNAQVAVAGASASEANGFFSITVTTATAFTYQTNQTIPAGSLLSGNVEMVTVDVGLPWEYTQIPQDGI